MTDAPNDLQQIAFYLQRFLRRNQVNGRFARVTIELDTPENRFRVEMGATREIDPLSAGLRYRITTGRFTIQGVDFKFTDEQERTKW